MSEGGSSTEKDLERAVRGEPGAVGDLLARHRARLRQVVAVRLDERLAARVDASDVVQDTLLEAAKRMPEYLASQRVPFFVWLRQLAWQRLAQLYRYHVLAQCRSVEREVPGYLPLSEESVMLLADRFAAGTSPSARLRQEELRQRVRAALDRLAPHDREVLVLRHLEQLSTHEISVILNISEPAVRYRQRRALERLAALLGEGSEDNV